MILVDRLKRKKGFTLIELLLVISIVTLLTSIILGSLNSARDKARIAKALQFDHHIQNAIGDRFVSNFPLDGGAVDTVGAGTIVSQIVGSPTPTSGIIGQAVAFDGDDWYATKHTADNRVGNNDSYAISVWFKTDQLIAQSIVGQWSSGGTCPWNIAINVNGNVEFTIFDHDTSEYNKVISEKNYVDNQFHHILAARNYTDDNIQLYIDGNLIGTTEDTTDGDVSSAGDFYIGYSYSGFFIGTIDEYRVYHASPWNN